MFFETERLIARPWTLDDAEAAYRMYGDPDVMRYLGRNVPEAVVPSLEEQRARLEKTLDRYANLPELQGWFFGALEEKATGEVVGATLLKPLLDGEDRYFPTEIEVGWHLAKAHWGRGFATESGRGAIQYGFEVAGLKEIHAIAYKENVASTHVMDKLGMTYMGSTDRYYGVTVEHYAIRAEGYGFA